MRRPQTAALWTVTPAGTARRHPRSIRQEPTKINTTRFVRHLANILWTISALTVVGAFLAAVSRADSVSLILQFEPLLLVSLWLSTSATFIVIVTKCQCGTDNPRHAAIENRLPGGK